MTSDTINLVNDIIDSYLTNSIYEELGNNFEAEYFDHLVFSMTNNQGSSYGAFQSTIDNIVNDIERSGIVVFDVQVDSGMAIIETAKN